MKKLDIDEEPAFANGLPLGFYSVISEGVHIVHAREKKRPWLQQYRMTPRK